MKSEYESEYEIVEPAEELAVVGGQTAGSCNVACIAWCAITFGVGWFLQAGNPGPEGMYGSVK